MSDFFRFANQFGRTEAGGTGAAAFGVWRHVRGNPHALWKYPVDRVFGSDSTPDDYRANGLRTSGTLTASGEESGFDFDPQRSSRQLYQKPAPRIWTTKLPVSARTLASITWATSSPKRILFLLPPSAGS